MKIVTNAIGNYSPSNIKSTNNVISAQKSSETKDSSKITKEEKDFFKKLYPENKQEIIDYHFYQKSGKMAGVTVGSLIDKRG